VVEYGLNHVMPVPVVMSIGEVVEYGLNHLMPVPVGAGRALSAICTNRPPVRWPSKCEADHSPQRSSEVKNIWSFIFSPFVHLHGLLLSTRTTFI
jgi:hypothetical protein